MICRKSKSLKKTKGASKDYELDLGIDMLNRDLDVVNFLQMMKNYHLTKQVMFTQDDRNLAKLQQRDMIRTSSNEEEKDKVLTPTTKAQKDFVTH